MKVALTLTGAVCELVALAFVVMDLRCVRDRASAYLLQPIGASLAQRSVADPESMTPAEREQAAAWEVKARLVAAISPPSPARMHAAEAANADLRQTLADSLTTGHWRRVSTVPLLAIGITFSAVANLL